LQGLVLTDEHARSVLYVANRGHLAWPSIEALVGLRATLLDRLRDEIDDWSAAPLHASMYGSAVRGDADERSDIDLLLVRPDETPEDPWESQLDSLRTWVRSATGNRCEIFDITRSRFTEHVIARDPLIESWRREGIRLAGASIESLVRSGRRTA
jgi:predicted nucleotidyltransferase